MRIQKADWSVFDETDDFSFGTYSAFPGQPWPKLTLYADGVVVFGTEP